MLITAIVLIAFAIYYIYLVRFWRGISKSNNSFSYEKKTVSVVIAARNEAKTLPQLLTALANQTYSNNLFEVIVANDSSTDRTAEIVEEFSAKWPFIKLHNVTGRENAASPKKNALGQVIELATGEIILSTDADCLVGKYWIESMVAHYKDDVQMVVGFSKTKLSSFSKSSFVRRFEHFDCNSMFSANAGAVATDKYFSCTGQNISYRKSAFQSVGGFEKIKNYISGDDVNLMQLYRLEGYKVVFAFSDHSFAVTRPIENWTQLLNQRSRWASNTKLQLRLNPEFFFYLMAAFATTIGPWILLFISPWIAISLILLRMAGEYRFLKRSFEVFKIENKILKFYPIWFIMQPIYMIVVASFGMFNVFRWKK